MGPVLLMPTDLWLAWQADAPTPAARLFGSLLMWIFVCVLLAVPMVIALRGASRRRLAARERQHRSSAGVDAWRESARRLEPGP
jgi:hypothetical protein